MLFSKKLALIILLGASSSALAQKEQVQQHHLRSSVDASTATTNINAHSLHRKLPWWSDDEPLSNNFCWVPFTECEADSCPQNIEPLSASEFNLTKYVEKSWYIQKQQVVPYQSEDQLYCVVATYNFQNDSDLIQVSNYGNNNRVNGPPQSSDSDDESFFGDLCAEQVNGGKLRVAPCFFEWVFGLAAGPYWVLDVADDYSWAIVSGGPPTEVRDTSGEQTLCTTKEGTSFLDINGSGLWLFTREQVASNATIDLMETKLTEMGYFTGDLLPVQQAGCDYEGANRKM